jgi:predicted porin
MKKPLALVFSMLFVLAFAVSAFAIDATIPAETQAVVAKGDSQITLGGEIRVRGNYERNTSGFNKDDANDKSANLEERIRLKVHAQVTPKVEGMIEMRDTKWSGDDDATWGVDGIYVDSRGTYPGGGEALGGGENTIQFIQAWIQARELLGTQLNLKIGHMPLALGNGLFYSHTKNGEDAIMIHTDLTDGLHVAAILAKLGEGLSRQNDDATYYAALFNYMTDTYNVSGDITYLDDQAFSTDGLHFWNFGLRGDTVIGGFNLRADVEIQTGEAEGTNTAGAGWAGTDVDVEGFAFLVGADYTLDNITLGLQYAYGSGDDNATDNKQEAFQTVLDNTWKSNYNPFVYEYRTVAGTGMAQTGISNTQTFRATASMSPLPDLNAKLYLWYITVPEDNMVSWTTAGVSNKDENAGWEIDLMADYKLAKNLTYFVEAGVLFADDFFKNDTTGVPAGADPDSAYLVRHGVTLSF